MKTIWCLFRERPFRVYFLGQGFERPKRDDTRVPKPFESEEAAKLVRNHLRSDGGDYVFIEKRSKILTRMKTDYDI